MKVTYDPEVDVLRIVFNDDQVQESDETRPGIIVDFGRDGRVIGFELLDASRHVSDPRMNEHRVAS